MRNYALAIHATGVRQGTPIVYELAADSIEIGSAGNNHIVLDGPGVEPYHLAVRWMDAELYLLIRTTTVDITGMGQRSDDIFYCAEHGKIARLTAEDQCPFCRAAIQPIWLLRRLLPGDSFPIGEGFEADVLSQGQPNQVEDLAYDQGTSSWPDNRWLENPPHPKEHRYPEAQFIAEKRSYPQEDSNLWVWNPPETPFPVFIHQRVNRWVTHHAIHNDDREVGGLLLGDVYQDTDTGTVYPVITHAIPARFAREERGHLTFTRETWLELHDKIQEQHPEQQIVGWYHTHPGLDIFLSEWDLFIHRNFFNQPWQVALVVDPARYEAGLFVWADDEILDPLHPHQLFRVADLDGYPPVERRAQVRIKLGEVVE